MAHPWRTSAPHIVRDVLAKRGRGASQLRAGAHGDTPPGSSDVSLPNASAGPFYAQSRCCGQRRRLSIVTETLHLHLDNTFATVIISSAFFSKQSVFGTFRGIGRNLPH